MKRTGPQGREIKQETSTHELLHLDPLQPLHTPPHRLADPDRQLAAFQPLIDKPQTHHELFLVQRRLGWRRRLARFAGNDKIPDCFEFAFWQSGAHPEVADDHVGDIVG
jgi:hypothetical protein